jgi:hypothetical protein
LFPPAGVAAPTAAPAVPAGDAAPAAVPGTVAAPAPAPTAAPTAAAPPAHAAAPAAPAAAAAAPATVPRAVAASASAPASADPAVPAADPAAPAATDLTPSTAPGTKAPTATTTTATTTATRIDYLAIAEAFFKTVGKVSKSKDLRTDSQEANELRQAFLTPDGLKEAAVVIQNVMGGHSDDDGDYRCMQSIVHAKYGPETDIRTIISSIAATIPTVPTAALASSVVPPVPAIPASPKTPPSPALSEQSVVKELAVVSEVGTPAPPEPQVRTGHKGKKRANDKGKGKARPDESEEPANHKQDLSLAVVRVTSGQGDMEEYDERITGRKTPSKEDHQPWRTQYGQTGEIEKAFEALTSSNLDWCRIPQGAWDVRPGPVSKDVRARLEAVAQGASFLISSIAADAGITKATAWKHTGLLQVESRASNAYNLFCKERAKELREENEGNASMYFTI